MEIVISPRIAQLVEEQITSGHYGSVDEVLEVALGLLAKRDQYDQWVQEVGESVDVAIQQLEQGEWVDGEVAVSQLRQRLSEKQR